MLSNLLGSMAGSFIQKPPAGGKRFNDKQYFKKVYYKATAFAYEQHKKGQLVKTTARYVHKPHDRGAVN